jgi:hypothetical protein
MDTTETVVVGVGVPNVREVVEAEVDPTMVLIRVE